MRDVVNPRFRNKCLGSPLELPGMASPKMQSCEIADRLRLERDLVNKKNGD